MSRTDFHGGDDEPTADRSHLLSFDVEEYFQVEAAARAGLDAEQWGSIPKRLGRSVDGVLQLLADYQTSATFFVLGWVAQQDAGLVRRIASAGDGVQRCTPRW